MNPKNLVLLYIILVSSFSCSAQDENSVIGRIKGGSPCTQQISNFLVSLRYFDGVYYIPFCVASLISPRFVLTAAHCATLDKKIFAIEAYKITSMLYSETANEVVKTYTHPNFNPVDREFDIGIMKLMTPILPSKYVSYTNIPYGKFSQNLNKLFNSFCKDVTLVGFGPLEGEVKDVSPMPYCIKTKVMDEKICEQKKQEMVNKWPYALTKKHICIAEDKKTVGLTDQGGPLVCMYFQFGIISYFFGEQTVENPTVAIMIESSVNWINKVAGIKTQKSSACILTYSNSLYVIFTFINILKIV